MRLVNEYRVANGFNPLPAFWPGETCDVSEHITQYLVSIHSRLFGREKPTPNSPARLHYVVSIHSRLFGREKLGPQIMPAMSMMFQSTPGFLAGRNVRNLVGYRIGHCVSIHSRLFGREKRQKMAEVGTQLEVSIHSRLFGREKRPLSRSGIGTLLVSIHSRLFGREKLRKSYLLRSHSLFQSTPGFLAGRNGCFG